MQHILRVSLLLMILFNFMWAFEVKDDREISVRKEIDSFARVEQKEVPTVDKFKKMFTDGKVTGQVRSMYVGYNYEQAGLSNTYATALGGMLKYELASLNGFNAGVSFITSHDISFVSGNKNSYKHNSELSSQSGHYVEASEAYINYRNGGFNFRAGRQTFDTPLADSDDVRMIPNTFEAYLVTYEIEDFICTVGNVQKWQGFGTGLGYDANGMKRDSNWIDIGHGGTWFGGINYTGPVEINAWYYDIPKPKHATKASYFDIGSHTSEGMITIHGSMQYIHETEVGSSNTQADIYGALVEVFLFDFGLNFAYNKAVEHKEKRSFSGIGGGSMYTSMDTMTIDEMTYDREVEAIVAGFVYNLDDWNLLYAYGNFEGKANSIGEKAHIVEQNFGLTYTLNDEFEFGALYVKEEDKYDASNADYNWERVQVIAKYDF